MGTSRHDSLPLTTQPHTTHFNLCYKPEEVDLLEFRQCKTEADLEGAEILKCLKDTCSRNAGFHLGDGEEWHPPSLGLVSTSLAIP